MIYFLVTTSLFNDCPIRKNQYTYAITKLKYLIAKYDIQSYKIIIIENNGKRKTILDDIGDDVFYTINNLDLEKNPFDPVSPSSDIFIKTQNKGKTELQDILDCISHYNIQDEDFIVKMTGRYIIDDKSEFMEALQNCDQYDCILRYGSFLSPSTQNVKMEDCITGLIGIRCKYVKQISMPNEDECVEWKWAQVTFMIEDSRIYIVKQLGVHICPGGNNYCFFV